MYRTTAVSMLAVGAIAGATAWAQPRPAQNFLGKNICMAIHKPIIVDIGGKDVPDPIVHTDVAANSRRATHTIALGDLGKLVIEERPAEGDECDRLPLDEATVHASSNHLDSTAEFCLSGDAGKTYVRVRGQATGVVPIEKIQSALSMVAVCEMPRGGLYYGGDTLTQRGQIILKFEPGKGPYDPR